MGVAVLNDTPKTILTLSAAPAPDEEHARVASRIERVLALVDYWRRMGQWSVADALLDELFDYVLARRRTVPPDAITESERRLLDGNR